MKNKTKKKIIIACLILFLLLVLNAIVFTYAKYMSSEVANGHAEIAEWSFKIVKEGEETKTINLIDTAVKSTLVDGKIAPGTSGKIQIELDGTGSEVGIDYQIEFANEQNKPKNLYFTVGNQKYYSISEIPSLTGKILCNEEDKKVGRVISWTWPYETGQTTNEIAQNDKIDTEDAKAISEFTFDVVVTATQSE